MPIIIKKIKAYLGGHCAMSFHFLFLPFSKTEQD